MRASAMAWVAVVLCAVLAGAVWRLLLVRMHAVARACHELRGPLTAARLGLQLADRAAVTAQRLRAIDAELGRAAVALEDLGDVRLVPRPRPRPRAGTSRDAAGCQRVDLAAVSGDSVEAWRAFAAARGVTVSFEWSGPGALVRADRFRLAQAVGNLVANAIEHGGGAVAVRGEVVAGVARVKVCDGGRGLPAPLETLVGRGRRRRGRRGHGLAIAADVVEGYGGRLSTGEAEQGASLILEMPIADS